MKNKNKNKNKNRSNHHYLRKHNIYLNAVIYIQTEAQNKKKEEEGIKKIFFIYGPPGS